MCSFIVLHAGMYPGPLLFFSFDIHSPGVKAGLLQFPPRSILAKALAVCFGLEHATVFGPFRKSEHQSSS